MVDDVLAVVPGGSGVTERALLPARVGTVVRILPDRLVDIIHLVRQHGKLWHHDLVETRDGRVPLVLDADEAEAMSEAVEGESHGALIRQWQNAVVVIHPCAGKHVHGHAEMRVLRMKLCTLTHVGVEIELRGTIGEEPLPRLTKNRRAHGSRKQG